MPTTRTTDSSSVLPIDQLVRNDRLKLLIRQSFPALFISLAIAVLLTWMLWPNLAVTTWLRGWLTVMAASTLARLAIFIGYFWGERKGQDLLRWEKPYFVTLLISSLIWGLGLAAMLPLVSAREQAVLLFFLMGMAGGAVSTFSAYRPMGIGSMCSILLPATLWFFCQSEHVQQGMAIASTVFMLASLRATKVLATSLRRNFQLAHELKAARDSADQLARTDPLTGINNRRAFFEMEQHLINACQRRRTSLSMLLIDIDHFKMINDSFGHVIGDAVLKQVATLLQLTFRKSDVYGRIGGDEFAVLLPDTDLSMATQIAKALCEKLAQTPIQQADKKITITASIGVSSNSENMERLFLDSDKAMFSAKMKGRNRVTALH